MGGFEGLNMGGQGGNFEFDMSDLFSSMGGGGSR